MATAPREPLASQPTIGSSRSGRSRAWKRFTANRMAVAGLIVVILLILMAVFADFLSPYNPVDEIFRGKRGAPPELGHPLGF